MTEDVKIKVSLDGDKVVINGLAGVGDTADKTDSKLERLAKGGLKGVGVALAGLGTAAVVGAGVAGKQLFDVAEAAAAAGDRVDKLSQKMGLSREGFQEWDYVLSQNGVSIDVLQGGLARLNQSVDDTISGNDVAAEKFARLGLSMEDLAGKSREDIFNLTIQGLQGIDDEGEKAAIAYDLLGRSASELNPLLNQTAESTDALRQRAQDLGLVLSDEAVDASVRFTDAMDSLKRTFSGVRNQIGAELLPGLSEITEGLALVLAGVDGGQEKIAAGGDVLVSSLQNVLPRILDVFSSLTGSVATVAPGIIQALIQGIVANIPSLSSTLISAVLDLVTIISGQLPSLITAGAQAVVAVAKGISSAVPTLVPAILEGIVDMVAALIQAAPMLLEAGIELISGLAEGLLAALPVVIDALPRLIESVVNFLTSSLPMLLDAGIQLFSGIVQALPDVISMLLTALPSMITAILNALVSAVPLLVNAGIQLLTSLVTALPEIITTIVEALPKIITSVITAVLDAIPLLIQAGIDLFIALIGALPQIIITIVEAIPKIITGVINALVDAIPQIIQAGVELLVALVSNMPAILGGIIGAIPQIISGIVGAIIGAVPQLADAGLRLIQGLWKGISDATGWLLNQIGGFVDTVMGGIKDFFGIASPAKRLDLEVGIQLPAGVGQGVKRNEQAALRPIRAMNDRIMEESLRLNTTASFKNEATLTQTLIPMQATPTRSGPINVEAALDTDALSSAMEEAFSRANQADQPTAMLADSSIAALAGAIVDAMRVQSRQGVTTLG